MMGTTTVFNKLINHVKNGGGFKINFKKKDLQIGGVYLVKNGKSEFELINDDDLELDIFDWKETLYILYKNYKHSIPHKNYHAKSYFVGALEFDELTDTDLLYNDDRLYAQAMLEGYVLLGILSNIIKFENENHYFYQDIDEKNLILFRKWF